VITDLWGRETELQQAGIMCLAGVDEVGRGPLAGPVVAAAVILPPPAKCQSSLCNLRDSKQLTARQREQLYDTINRVAIAVGIGWADVKYIDKHNILQATRTAMRRAILKLKVPPDYVLVDAVSLTGLACLTEAIIRGDKQCGSIAAASIIAKVYRDRLMIKWDQTYPGYGFARNKGYGTPEHLAALTRLGPCPLHRLSFKPVRLAKEAMN
jgi:ribonuclease HII